MSTRRTAACLTAGAVIAALARVLVSRHAVGPEIVADEAAFLSMARFLAGDRTWWQTVERRGFAAWSLGRAEPTGSLAGHDHLPGRARHRSAGTGGTGRRRTGGRLIPIFEA